MEHATPSPSLGRAILFLFLFLTAAFHAAFAQVVQTFNSSGTFVAPAGVTQVVVDCIGGGGRGGTRSTNGQGGGGGGGAYASSVITVVPGNSYTVTVGAGSTSAASPGGDSWFISPATLMAKGGNSVADNVSTGAAGGSAAASVGSRRLSGGNGANGASSTGGGGGSSAGYGGVGGVSIGLGVGGVAPGGGGTGGTGAVLGGNGTAGSGPGGGGGGAAKWALSGTGTGGGGGTGRVVVSYYTPGTCMTGASGINGITDNGCALSATTRVPLVISGLPTTLGTGPGEARLLTVQLVVAHTFNGDMQITLTSPSGSTRNLVLNKFGNGDNLGNPATCPNALFTLQDGGTALSTTNTSNVTGTYAPEQTLAGFTGDPNGLWLLNVCDNAAGDVGFVRYAHLNFCVSPTATFTPVDDCNGGDFNVNVNVTSLGSAASANLSYTVNGSAPVNVPNIGAGITTIGPFVLGSEVIATVSSATSGCGSVQGAVYSNCPYNIPCGNTISVGHCYRNNDPRTFTFISGSPFETVTLNFVSGTMAAGDVIRAYSGSDNSGDPIPSLTGNFPSLVGASGTSTGSTLFLEIDSDGSNSCATGQQTSWLMEARCTPGCTDPDGAVQVNTVCASYDFNIDVEILFTGDASTTTVRYTVNGGPPTDVPGLMELDVVNIGPFAIDDVVNVRLLHENNSSCDRNLGNYTDNNSCPGGENCVNALNLASQTSPLPGTTLGRTNEFSFACGTATANTAPDAIYYIDVPNGAELNIRQQSNTYDSQHYVRYGGACPGMNAIACVDNDAGETGFVNWANTTGTTQRVWWIQDGFGSATGNFVLQWQLTTCPVVPGPPTVTTGTYAVCQNTTVPIGEGLAASCANATQTNTYAFPGGGLISEGTSLTTRSTLVVPALPAGAIVTAARLRLTGVVANTGLFGNAQRQNLRVALAGAVTLGETQLTVASGPGSITPDPVVNLTGFPAGGGSIDLRTRQTSDQLWTNPDVNIGSASIEVDYSVPISVRWYGTPVAGTLLSTGPVFDPVGQGAVNNAVPGNTTFYATCGFSACENIRAAATFTVIAPANAGTNGSLTLCDNASSVPLFASLGGSPQSGGDWSGPSIVVGGAYDPVGMLPGPYVYTVQGTAPCPNASATVSVSETPSTPWYADTDGDGFGAGAPTMACASPFAGAVENNTDDCPGVFGLVGNACNDGDPFTYNDVLGPTCSCAGSACTVTLALEFQLDGVSTENWEIRAQGTNTLIQSGAAYLPVVGNFSVSTCVPDGCFYLKVTDDGADGITGGGYSLRMQSGKRIIDNRNNFTSGAVSQIAGNQGWCVTAGTIGNDRLITASCDRLDLQRGANATCSEKLTADNTPNNTSGSVYQFWVYNPNGPESQMIPATGAGSNILSMNQITLPAGKLYNVRVRTRISPGVYRDWGPACRMSISPTPTPCRITKLVDDVSSVNWSCGKTVVLPAIGGGSGAPNMLVAKPATRLNASCVEVGANKYQFRIKDVDTQVTTVVNGIGSNYYCYMTRPAFGPCRQFEVDVRCSFDNGTTWCAYSDVCTVYTGGCLWSGGEHMATEGAGLLLYPNPSRGDHITLRMEDIDQDVSTASLDIYDAFGKRVITRTIPVQDRAINTVLELGGKLASGLYLVDLSAGGKTHAARLVIEP